MAAPKRRPIEQQIAEGDPRKIGAKKLREQLGRQVQATRGLPDCPKHLRGRARAAWKFWVEELRAMNIDSRPDAMMLEGACVNYARALTADSLVRSKGLVVRSGDKWKTHPAVHISTQAWRLVRAFCSEFGCSPVSRMRLTIEKPDTSSQDLMQILKQPREPRPQSVQ